MQERTCWLANGRSLINGIPTSVTDVPCSYPALLRLAQDYVERAAKSEVVDHLVRVSRSRREILDVSEPPFTDRIFLNICAVGVQPGSRR